MPNLVRLAAGLELVRAALGNKPIHVTSGFRSARLNQMLGGSKHSMHTRGLAADILCPQFGTPLEVCEQIARSGSCVRPSDSRIRPVVPRGIRRRRAGAAQRTTDHSQRCERLRVGLADHMNTSEIVCLSQSERQTFDQREVMTGNRLPRDPTALFDLADRIANSLAEKRPVVVRDLNAALELVTKLNAATYAYCVYLVIRHGAKHSAVARSFLSQAARNWHRKEIG